MNKSRVLVVDDESALSALVRMTLEETGVYEVMVENLPYQALATARHFRPHIIVLDVNMPGKDGADVAAEIRADGDLAGTPILFHTSLVSPEEAEDRARSGMEKQFLSKKADPAVLTRTIKNVLDRAAAAKPIRLFVQDDKGSIPPEQVQTFRTSPEGHDRSGL
jgi:two-component system response regulator MtrA